MAKRSSTTLSSWSDLPEGLLHSILILLPSIRDLVSFSCVCRSWRIFVSSSRFSSLFPPLLLYPLTIHRRGTRSRISSFRLHDPASPSLFYPLYRTSVKPFYNRFLAYSHGHILFLSGKHILVINPFTGSQLHAPPLSSEFVTTPKALLTAPPSFSGSILLLVSGDRLYQWRIGSSKWSSCELTLKCYANLRLIAMERKIYIIDPFLNILISDSSTQISLRNLEVYWPSDISDMICLNLINWFVDYGGVLLLLQFELGEEMLRAKFKAFRMEGSSWVKMENLGEWAVFVGSCPTVPGLACKNPERWGGRKNCIYFARYTGDDGNGAWTEIQLGEEIDISDPESPFCQCVTNFTPWPAPLWVYPSMVL